VHSVTTLEKCGEGSIREVILHLEQVNELRHDAALLNHCVEVKVGILNELLNRFLVGEDAVLFVVFEDTEVGLTRHQEALLDDVNETETQEV